MLRVAQAGGPRGTEGDQGGPGETEGDRGGPKETKFHSVTRLPAHVKNEVFAYVRKVFCKTSLP